MPRRRAFLNVVLGLAMTLVFAAPPSKLCAQTKKPNIIVIWGDDIGLSDISAYSIGLMGFHTPNIDRIAKEGMIFTDYYG